MSKLNYNKANSNFIYLSGDGNNLNHFGGDKKYYFTFFTMFLRSPMIDHLQIALSLKTTINSPRINQNRPGEIL